MLTSWIPSPFGRVSFSQIGRANTNKRRTTVNFDDGRNRYVVVKERRETRDSLISSARLFKLDLLLNKLSNEFDYYILAKSKCEAFNRQNRLEGIIAICEARSVSAKEASEIFEEATTPMKLAAAEAKAASGWQNCFDAQRQYEQERRFIELTDNLSNKCLFHFGFSLDRYGRFDIQDAAYRSDLLPNRDETSAKEAMLRAAFHGYLFAKDCTHQHTHHAPDSDSILDLHLTYGTDELEVIHDNHTSLRKLRPETTAKPNDVNWREEVLYSLHRRASLLQIRNSAKELSLASGIIKYASDFDQRFGLSDVDRKLDDRFSKNAMIQYRWPSYDLANGFEIVKTRIEEQKATETDTDNYAKAIFALSITVVTVALSYTSLLRLVDTTGNESSGLIPSSSVDPILLKLARIFLENFSLLAIVLIAIFATSHLKILWKKVSNIKFLGQARKILLRLFLHAWGNKFLVLIAASAIVVLAYHLIEFGWSLILRSLGL